MTAERPTSKISFRLDDDRLHTMQVIVQGKLSGFETMSDLHRFCVDAGLEKIQQLNPDDPELLEVMSLVEAHQDLMRADRYRQATKICDGISRSINDARQAGDERWIGDTREAALHFAQATPFRTLADRMMREAGTL